MADSNADSPAFLAQDRSSIFIGFGIFYIFIMLSCVPLRFYARSYAQLGWWWDDWLCLIGVPFALVSPIIDIALLHYGFGRHEELDSQHRFMQYLYYLFVLLPFYNIGLAFFKLSFLAFYIRVFPVVRWMRHTSFALAGLITAWMIATECIIIFRCTPIASAWNQEPGKCIRFKDMLLSQSLPSIFFDLTILVLPIRLVCNLQLNMSQKIGIIGIFMLGGLVTITSILRLAAAISISDTDTTWSYVNVGIWSATEPVVGLLCCCLLTYGKLFRTFCRNVRFGLSCRLNRSDNTKQDFCSAGGIADRTLLPRSAAVRYEPYHRHSDEIELTQNGNSTVVKTSNSDGGSQRLGAQSGCTADKSDQDDMAERDLDSRRIYVKDEVEVLEDFPS